MALKPTLIDRAIGYFSPSLALSRTRDRVRMSQYYDAAGRTVRTQGMRAPGGDANAAALSGPIIRKRARDMVRNNAIATRAVSALVDNIVGDGIIPSVEAERDEDKRRLEEVLLEHFDSTAVDAAGRLNLYGLQRLAVDGMIVGGEMLWRRRPRRASDALAVLPFQVESLEPEYLDDRRLGQLQTGNLEYDGIEFDAIRRRVAYRLFREHPEDSLTGFPESRRVMADEVLHLYRVDRPNQRRGVTWLAPVISLLSDAYEYADAQLVRQKIAAMWVGFTVDALNDVGEQTDYDKLTLKPGTFEHLPPGRDVRFSDPPKVEGYAEHMKQVQRMVAAALGITYEELSGDLEGVNFSSGRLGRIAMQRAVQAAQWTVVMPVLCDGMNRWIRDAVDVFPERLVRGAYKINWTPPRFQMTDPAREIPAMVQEIEAGLTSRQRKIREMGYDPSTIAAEIEEDRAMFGGPADRQDNGGATGG